MEKKNDNFRKSVIQLINKKINNRKICINIEKSIFNYAIIEAKNRHIVRKWENKYFLQLYKNRLRSIYLNLKNESFINKINNGIKTQQLEKMSHQEMCPEKWKDLIDAKIKRDKNMTSVNMSAATDEFKCYKCKKRKCTYYQLQTRSADEPMTTFVTCLVCSNRWKC
jgi:transcription elongation factor S-II